LALLGPRSVKAARKMLVKLTHYAIDKKKAQHLTAIVIFTNFLQAGFLPTIF